MRSQGNFVFLLLLKSSVLPIFLSYGWNFRIAVLNFPNWFDQVLNINIYYRCCSGFCVDLVQKFSEDLSFDFQLVRVKDGKWGGVVNGKWNGLVAELINHETGTLKMSLPCRKMLFTKMSHGWRSTMQRRYGGICEVWKWVHLLQKRPGHDFTEDQLWERKGDWFFSAFSGDRYHNTCGQANGDHFSDCISGAFRYSKLDACGKFTTSWEMKKTN